MRKLTFFLVVVGVLYFVFDRDDPTPNSSSEPSSSESAAAPDTTPASSYSGTSGWGSGHQAGYDWAQEKGIDDDSDCEAAGDHSNSPSFAEGCMAYVHENQ